MGRSMVGSLRKSKRREQGCYSAQLLASSHRREVMHGKWEIRGRK